MANHQPKLLVTLTADIVSAHLSNNIVHAGDIPRAIANVHAALAGLGGTATPTMSPAAPATSIKSSIKPDSITCLECGRKGKLLKRHLRTSHGLTPFAYRIKWGLPASYPMAAPNYAAQRRGLAIDNGLGRKTNGPTSRTASKGKKTR